MGAPILGRDGIRDYWQTKVVEGQANITCDLLNLYLDDGTAIAEWQAEFDDTAQQIRKRMREVALLTFRRPPDREPPRILGLRGGRAVASRDPQPGTVTGQDRNGG